MTISAQRRQVLFSTDGHAGADILGYKPYLESTYHEAFDTWAANYHDAWAEDIDQDRVPNHRVGVASAQASVNWDTKERLALLDDQGITAEVLFPTPRRRSTLPERSPRPAPQRRGARAALRWGAGPQPLVGGLLQRRTPSVGRIRPDLPRRCRRCHRRGPVGEGLRSARCAHSQRPRAADGQPLLPRGTTRYGRCVPSSACRSIATLRFPTEPIEEGGQASALIGMTEMQFYVMRSMVGIDPLGVFERHPDLTYVVTEITSASQIQGYLAQLDGMLQAMNVGEHLPMYEQTQDAVAALQKLPSEYFAEIASSPDTDPTTCAPPTTSVSQISCGVPTFRTRRAPTRTRSRRFGRWSRISRSKSSTSSSPSGPPSCTTSTLPPSRQWRNDRADGRAVDPTAGGRRMAELSDGHPLHHLRRPPCGVSRPTGGSRNGGRVLSRNLALTAWVSASARSTSPRRSSFPRTSIASATRSGRRRRLPERGPRELLGQPLWGRCHSQASR